MLHIAFCFPNETSTVSVLPNKTMSNIQHPAAALDEGDSDLPNSSMKNPPAGSTPQPGGIADSGPPVSSFEECTRVLDRYAEARGSDFYFIQIGANDGVAYDPIRKQIEKYHWRGILIEPVEHHFQRLVEHHRGRTGLIFENLAIAPHDGAIAFHHYPRAMEKVAGFPPWAKGMGSILEPFGSHNHRIMEEMGLHMETIEVPCVTFSTLIRRHRVTEIDLLQIDAEGFDGEIICHIDFALLKPKFIRYERRHIQRAFRGGFARHSEDEVKSWLENAGYKVFSSPNGFDTICVS